MAAGFLQASCHASFEVRQQALEPCTRFLVFMGLHRPHQIVHRLYRVDPFGTVLALAQVHQLQELLPVLDQETGDFGRQLLAFQALVQHMPHHVASLGGTRVGGGLLGRTFLHLGNALLVALDEAHQVRQAFLEYATLVIGTLQHLFHQFREPDEQRVLGILAAGFPADTRARNFIDELARGVFAIGEK